MSSQLSDQERHTEETERRASEPIGERTNSKLGRKLVTGKGTFANDIERPGTLHARFVRSQYAHARIVDIDTSEAEAMPGVELVWTAADFAPLTNKFAHNSVNPPDEEPVASERVRYEGDEVAVVLATDYNTAVEAADRVDVSYEQLDTVISVNEALADGAPLVHPELDEDPESNVSGNTLREFTITTGDVDEAFADAEVVVEGSFHTNKTNSHPLEPHGCFTEYNSGDGELTMWSSHQAPHLLKATLADAIPRLEEDDIVCKMPDIGGGFGQKIELFSHEVCAAALAIETDRPIKFVLDRLEEFQAGRGRNEAELDGRLAVDADGSIIGWDVEMRQNTGAYGSYGQPVAFSSSITSSGPYLIPNQRIVGRVIYTNKMPTSAYRGYGDPQYSYVREQLLDMAAEKLDLDPIEIRLRNVPSNDDMPLLTPKGLKWECGDLEGCLRRVREMINWDEHHGGYRTRDGKLRGVGVGAIVRRNGNRLSGAEKQPEGVDEGLDVEEAIVKMDKDAKVKVLCGITSIGQGTETGIAQIAADVLGVPTENVKPEVGSTDLTPYGMGVWADRGATIGGTAVARAAEDLKESLVTLAAHQLDVKEDHVVLADGRAYEDGNSDNGIPIADVAYNATFGGVDDRPPGMEEGVSLVGRGVFESRATESPLDRETGTGSISHSYTFGALAVLVEVDPGTGEVEVVDVAFAEDAGTIINPKLVEGQAQGAIVQALGETLLENYHYDDRGHLENGSMVDYHLPTMADVPVVTKIDEIETPSPSSSHGQKGVGETPTPITPVAVANALTDAIGIRFYDLPLSPSTVLPRLVDSDLRVL